MTRNEEFDVDEDSGDGEPSIAWQRATMRRHLGLPVRLTVEDPTSARMLEIPTRYVDAAAEDVYRVRAPLGITEAMLAITPDRSSGAYACLGTPDDYPRNERDGPDLGLI